MNVLLNNRVDSKSLVIMFISLSLGSVVVFVTRVKREMLSARFTETFYFEFRLYGSDFEVRSILQFAIRNNFGNFSIALDNLKFV